MKQALPVKLRAYPIPRVTFPVVHLDGEPYDQGLQHGVALRAQIAHNLDVYYDRILREGQLQPEEARARAATYAPVLDGGAYYQALAGMARGSRQKLIDLVVLNLRYELLYYQYRVCAGRPPHPRTPIPHPPAATPNP